ncbi:hypothetical protein, partial [Zooshikella harenae]
HTFDSRHEIRKDLKEKKQLLASEMSYYRTQIYRIDSDIALFNKLLNESIPQNMLEVPNIDKDKLYEQFR